MAILFSFLAIAAEGPAAGTASALAGGATAAPANADEVKLSGVVRFVRENPVPQVFFVGLDGTYLIQDGSDYARAYEVFLRSMKTKKPVNFTYNKKTKTIIAVEGSYNKSTAVYEESTVEPESDEKEKSDAPKKASAEEQRKSMEDFLKTLDSNKK